MATFSILGDSISTFTGYNPEGYVVFYDKNNCMLNGLSSVEETWWHQVITALNGSLLVNASYSGSRVSGNNFPAANTMQRIEALHSNIDPDNILIHLGHNDYGFNVPISPKKSEENDVTYFYKAYSTMLERIIQRYPSAKIYCSTLMSTYILYRPDWHLPHKNGIGISFSDYNEAIRKACRLHDVILVDLNSTGIECDTLDGAHGTKRGHSEMAKAWKQCLLI